MPTHSRTTHHRVKEGKVVAKAATIVATTTIPGETATRITTTAALGVSREVVSLLNAQKNETDVRMSIDEGRRQTAKALTTVIKYMKKRGSS